MAGFNKYFVFLLLAILLTGCKTKKKPSLSGEELVEYNDFIDFFPVVKKLPYQFEEASLLKKDNDSLLISYKVLAQFVPDSVLDKLFGKGVKPRIYPMAKTVNDDSYLFAKAVTGNKRMAFVLAFDKKKEFMAAMPMLVADQLTATRQNAGIDNKFTLYENITRRNADGSISEGKDVYILNNDARNFMLIMHDPLDDQITELINPIDTLPRKQKYSADYGSGKMNLVSIRDGRKGDRVSFFIHFERNNGACTGELKGVASMKTATLAEYHEPGEPCSLQFIFSTGAVKIKELGGCGSRRGLRCSFDGSYPRKKEIKPKPVTVKKKGK